MRDGFGPETGHRTKRKNKNEIFTVLYHCSHTYVIAHIQEYHPVMSSISPSVPNEYILAHNKINVILSGRKTIRKYKCLPSSPKCHKVAVLLLIEFYPRCFSAKQIMNNIQKHFHRHTYTCTHREHCTFQNCERKKNFKGRNNEEKHKPMLPFFPILLLSAHHFVSFVLHNFFRWKKFQHCFLRICCLLRNPRNARRRRTGKTQSWNVRK